ncbi:MAG: anion transporter [Nitrospirae bacterium]|nr:anion transporter [Nitrospirota bacterium]
MMWTALTIFLITYAVIGIQRIPGIHISRAAGALIGAVAMGVFGVLSLDEIYAAIDLDTLIFLLGMMILVSVLEISGFFERLEGWILQRARTGEGLLKLVILSSGLLSPLFMNDTICLMFTPVVLRLTGRIGAPPVPYLIALVTAANIGSVMTLIGNPQNMLVGVRSGIPFLEFTGALWPVSASGLLLDYALILWVYRREIGFRIDLPLDLREKAPLQPYLFSVSLMVMAVFLILLCLGFPPHTTAISLAALLILLVSNRPRRPLQQVDWTLLLLFAGLFIVMRGVEKAGLIQQVLRTGEELTTGDGWNSLVAFSGITLGVSNLVSNVPAVLLLSPLTGVMPDPHQAWLILAMVSTLAGNLTLVGSAANLIVVEMARRGGVFVGFMEYLKIGVPLTFLTTVLGVWLLHFH